MDANHKELIRLAIKLRKYQRQFFQEKSKESLARSLQYEKRIDQLLFAMSKLNMQNIDREAADIKQLIIKMRRYQRDYFRFKSADNKKAAMNYEQRLDQALMAYEQSAEAPVGEQLSLLGPNAGGSHV